MQQKHNDNIYLQELEEAMICDNGVYCVDMQKIDRIVKIKELTKLREQYYLFRKEQEDNNTSKINREFVYYVTDENAYVLGRIIIKRDISQDNLIMDCWLKKEYRKKGIAPVVFDTILNEIFVVKVFDDLRNYHVGIEKCFISMLKEDGMLKEYFAKKSETISKQEKDLVLVKKV